MDLGRTLLPPYQQTQLARLRGWVSAESDFVASTVNVNPGSFVPNYVRGLRAAEADLEFLLIVRGYTQVKHAARATREYEEGWPAGRLEAVFGADTVAAEGFRAGYEALLSHVD